MFPDQLCAIHKYSSGEVNNLPESQLIRSNPELGSEKAYGFLCPVAISAWPMGPMVERLGFLCANQL